MKRRFSAERIDKFPREAAGGSPAPGNDQHALEVGARDRFTFGDNWSRFLAALSEQRIQSAIESLQSMLGRPALHEMSFLDVGSGSGLFSLAARRLGARVVSFDFDPQSVACTAELRRRYLDGDSDWRVETGSVLDKEYVARLGTFDVVYSWGVLHHTGDLRRALDNVALSVKSGGTLFIALYNDQGWISRYWAAVKRRYNQGSISRVALTALHAPWLYGVRAGARVMTDRLELERGMSLWHDMVDWLGGWPFEVASPDDIVTFYGARGFKLRRLRTVGTRSGCNEFVFQRVSGH
jgi:SAM-dependent methyltransferase